MEYKMLGRTGLKVSMISLGGMNLGRLDEDVAFSLLDKAHDLGINLIDTSSGYGTSERVIGSWLAATGNRDDMIINTKVGWPAGNGPNERGLGSVHIMRQLEKSLQDLQTDYIDIYQAHYYDGEEDLYTLVRLFHDLVANGQIRVIGAPLFMRSYNMVAWYYLAHQHGLHSIGSKLMTSSLLSRGMYDGNTRHIARDYDIGLITFGALGGGLLSGKYHSSREFPANGKKMFEEYVTSGKIDPIVDYLEQKAKELDTTVAKLSFAWVLHHDFMDSVVIGASNPEQLEDILTAQELKLDDDLFAEMTRLSDQHHLW